ncbi:MAG: hypothetical protein O3A51_05080, partial [Verrucomicrobia bacterium]|nr:hypothetical protein [Verrucomicrobiota bacterium]
MNLTLKARLIVCFGGLMAVTVLVILLLMGRFVQTRIVEDVASRLNDSATTLVRVHESAKAERAARIISLSREPLIRALATVDDEPTLQSSAAELRAELGLPLIAFLTPEGDVLAWNGDGESVYRGGAIVKSADDRHPTSSYIRLGDRLLEVHLVPVDVAGQVSACLLAGSPFDNAVLA